MIVDRTTGEHLYPCDDCGVLRTKAEGGTVFTVCDACWDKHHPPCESVGAKLLSASREQLIEEILRLRGELAVCQKARETKRGTLDPKTNEACEDAGT